MTDRYENIRQALAMGPTPGPWQLSIETPTIIKQDLSSIGLSRGGVLIGSACGHESSGVYPTREQAIANARLIAACDPDTIRALLAERDELAKDAARYRWLRQRWGRVTETYDGDSGRITAIGTEPGGEGWDIEPETLDAAIDAAMLKAREEA